MKVNNLYRLEWRTIQKTKAGKAPPVDGLQEPTLTAEDEKKLKGLRKKLKEIEDLKEKLDIGLDLEENQKKKITTEAQVLKDIEALLKKAKIQ